MSEMARSIRAAKATAYSIKAARLTAAAGLLRLANAVERFAEQLAEAEQRDQDQNLFDHPDLMDLDLETGQWYGPERP
jgi:hypothetical protein